MLSRFVAVLLLSAQTASGYWRSVPTDVCKGHEGYNKVWVDGLHRPYYLYVPWHLAPGERVPLWLILGGTGETATWFLQYSGLGHFAKEKRFAYIAYQPHKPSPYKPRLFNLHAGVLPDPRGTDDLAYVQTVLKTALALPCIDLQHVHCAGFSNGGRYCVYMASELSEVIASISVTGALRYPSQNAAVRAMPVLAFHGTNDAINPWLGNGDPYWTMSVMDAFTKWGEFNGCNATTDMQWRYFGADIRGITLSDGCRDGADVELVNIVGGVHAWPGCNPKHVYNHLKDCNQEISANDLTWAFFNRHSLSLRSVVVAEKSHSVTSTARPTVTPSVRPIPQVQAVAPTTLAPEMHATAAVIAEPKKPKADAMLKVLQHQREEETHSRVVSTTTTGPVLFVVADATRSDQEADRFFMKWIMLSSIPFALLACLCFFGGSKWRTQVTPILLKREEDLEAAERKLLLPEGPIGHVRTLCHGASGEVLRQSEDSTDTASEMSGITSTSMDQLLPQKPLWQIQVDEEREAEIAAQQEAKAETAEAESGPFRAGARVEYYSKNNGKWISAVIGKVHDDGACQILAKGGGVVIKERADRSLLREPGAAPEPVPSRRDKPPEATERRAMAKAKARREPPPPTAAPPEAAEVAAKEAEALKKKGEDDELMKFVAVVKICSVNGLEGSFANLQCVCQNSGFPKSRFRTKYVTSQSGDAAWNQKGSVELHRGDALEIVLKGDSESFMDRTLGSVDIGFDGWRDGYEGTLVMESPSGQELSIGVRITVEPT